MFRSILMLSVVFGVGCLQLTGVSDYKVEEACPVQPGGGCRVAPNCGCPGTQTCQVADATGAGACADSGATPAGALCTTNGECAKGLACFVTGCQSFCRTDADCPEKQCETVSLDGTPVTGVGTCFPPCDPAASSCAGGRACQFLRSERTTCVPAGSSGAGGSCNTGTECAPGLICLTGNVCAQLCFVGSTCASGAECQDLGLTYKGTAYGACPAPG